MKLIKTKASLKAYIAEFIGTACLVFFGCGTACMVGCEVKGGYLMTALAFGLALIAMAYSIGNVSGCHINPAVSLAMLISGKMSARDFVGYVISQFLGAIAASAVLCIFFDASKGLGSNGLFKGSYIKSILIEIILTFVFVFLILGVTSKIKNAQISGLIIGLTLTLVHILGIGFTGTSVNPARSFGPAIFAGIDSFKVVWVFIVAPLIGAALAAVSWKAIEVKE